MSAQEDHNTPFRVILKKNYDCDVYLACSWKSDRGQDAAWQLVRQFDQESIRAIGDVTGFDAQDESRIARILRQCSGFAIILPYRKEETFKTSPYILDELRIVAELDLPVIIFADKRIEIECQQKDGKTDVTVSGEGRNETITVSHANVQGPYMLDPDSSAPLSPFADEMESFVERCKRRLPTHAPFAFLSTRLKPDFEQARMAIKYAVENAAGVKCLWVDSNEYSMEGVKETYQRTHLLIKNSLFVVADMTYGPESDDFDSPSRAHEIGISEAYGKDICMTAQAPRRSPYFAAEHIQMFDWKDEEELKKLVEDWVYIHRGTIGRRIYNYELSERLPDVHSSIDRPQFEMDSKKRYLAPNAFKISPLESWLVAIGIGMTALSASLMADSFLGYSETFDFAAVLAGGVALVFASDLNRNIRRTIARHRLLRMFIPFVGMSLLLIWALLR